MGGGTPTSYPKPSMPETNLGPDLDHPQVRRLEAALHDTEARYRFIMDHAPFGVSVLELLDDDLLVVSINAVGARHFALSREEVEGRRISELGCTADEITGLVGRHREAQGSE